METKQIEVGSRVRLSLACTNTKENYGTNHMMRELFGTVQTVKQIYNGIVRIQDWDWHIDDLILLHEKAPRKKIEIQLFDTDYLDI